MHMLWKQPGVLESGRAGAAAPSIRVREYIAAQSDATVRASLRKLVRGRPWMYVTFQEFHASLAALAARLQPVLDEHIRAGGVVCFMVEHVHKSSFWVLVLVLRLMQPWLRRCAQASDADGGTLAFAVGDNMMSVMRKLPQSTTLAVLVDDVTYSGEQLSTYHVRLRAQWAATHPRAPGLKTVVAVPFMSPPSLRAFEGASAVMHERLLPALLHGRPLQRTLTQDLFLCDARGRVRSLWFDVLGVRPSHAVALFEHKIADGLSIPSRWLHIGACVGPEHVRALLIAPGRPAALMVQKLLTEVPSLRSGAASQMDVARAVCSKLETSSAFARRFCLPIITLRPPTLQAPPYIPLLPPEYCNEAYQQFLQRSICSAERSRTIRGRKDGVQGDGDPRALQEARMYLQLPECQAPPYRRKRYLAATLRARA